MRGNTELPPACPLTSLLLTNFSIALTRSAAVGTSVGACRAASKEDCKTRTAKEEQVSQSEERREEEPHTPKLSQESTAEVRRTETTEGDGVLRGVDPGRGSAQ